MFDIETTDEAGLLGMMEYNLKRRKELRSQIECLEIEYDECDERIDGVLAEQKRRLAARIPTRGAA